MDFNDDLDRPRQPMETLRRQHDREAIAQGIAEMLAGEGVCVDEARRMTRERLLARKTRKN